MRVFVVTNAHSGFIPYVQTLVKLIFHFYVKTVMFRGPVHTAFVNSVILAI